MLIERMAQYGEYLVLACTFTLPDSLALSPNARDRIWKHWEDFCKYLNRLVYDHMAERYGKTLLIIPALHGDGETTRFHFHAAIGYVDMPCRHHLLIHKINDAWRKMKWSANEIEVKPYIDIGWLEYMAHEFSRHGEGSIDIARCCIPKELL